MFSINPQQFFNRIKTDILLTHKQPSFPHYEQIICGLSVDFSLPHLFLCPAQGVVENRPPLSGALERQLRVGERLEGGENLSLWPIKCL